MLLQRTVYGRKKNVGTEGAPPVTHRERFACGDEAPRALSVANRGKVLYLSAMRHEPYSYRGDPSVPPFDDSAPLIIFDGHCVLCASGVAWMLARDPHGTSRHAVVQSPIPQALYRHYGLDADQFDTFMVLWNGVPYVRWAASLAAARTMPWPWRWLGQIGRIVPGVIGDRIYNWVQRNRIRWFGARAQCFRPAPGEAHRFLT